MDSSIQFWNRTAERYAKRPVADETAYRSKLSITQKYLHPDMDVLEIGCGTGSTALIHAPKVRTYLATDASHRMIEIARDKLDHTNVRNLEFRLASLDDLGNLNQQFDAVLCLNLLHLLKDPKSAIEQVLGLVKPGGVFVSTTACLKDKKSWLRPVAVAARLLRLAPFVAFLSKQELKNCLQEAGFDILHTWVPENTSDVLFAIAARPAQSTCIDRKKESFEDYRQASEELMKGRH